MGSYPTGGDYREALQHPNVAFRDADLRAGTVRQDALGMPKAISGAFASVFTVTGADGRTWAVKCFTREVGDQATRYRAISDALRPLRYGWKVDFEFEVKGVLVAGRWYPLLRMRWVESKSLLSFIEANLWDSSVLARVAANFAQAVADLDRAGIAHGDLQHGNILVAADGSIRLIDYDGMYVPALATAGATEKGQQNYQSPLRAQQWGPELDRFSAWLIYTNLLALSIDPSLWPRLHQDGDEALLLRADDFAAPERSACWMALACSGDGALVAVLEALRPALKATTLEEIPRLDVASLPKPLLGLNAPLPSAPGAVGGGGLPAWLTDVAATTGTPSVRPGATDSKQGSGHGAGWIAHHLPPSAVPAPAPVSAGRHLLTWSGLIALLLASALPVLPSLGGAAVLVSVVVLVALGIAYARSGDRALLRDRKAQWKSVQQERRRVESERNTAAKGLRDAEQAASRAREAARRQVERARKGERAEVDDADRTLQKRLADINARRQKVLSAQQLEIGQALRQLQDTHVRQYLSRFTIRSAGLPGIGPSASSSMEAHGIRTAADFVNVWTGTGGETYLRATSGNNYRIAGIGPKKGQVLNGWRKHLLAAAVTKQPGRLDPVVERAINSRFEQQMLGLASEEKAARVAASARKGDIQQRWQAKHDVVARALRDEQVQGDRRKAAAAQQAATCERMLQDVEWRLSRAERELRAVGDQSFRRYLRRGLRRV